MVNEYCPVCLKHKTYRERRPGRRPKDPNMWVECWEDYDYCDVM